MQEEEKDLSIMMTFLHLSRLAKFHSDHKQKRLLCMEAEKGDRKEGQHDSSMPPQQERGRVMCWDISTELHVL